MEHLPKDCPLEKPRFSTFIVPNTTRLNLIEVISSPKGSKKEVENVSLRVVTQAQVAREDTHTQPTRTIDNKRR